MEQQYTFHFLEEDKPIYSDDSYIESEINEEAVKWINSWPDMFIHNSSIAHMNFPNAMVICGAKGSGKTHLANQWNSRVDAEFIDNRFIENIHNFQSPKQKYYILEDLHLITCENSLLHFFNMVKETGSYILFTSLYSPSRIGFNLPDLKSRLNAIPVIELQEPDDELLLRILAKFFYDRQLNVSEEAIKYLLYRIDRSIESAKNIVNKLDYMSLIEKKAITIPFIKETMSGDSNNIYQPNYYLDIR